MTLSTTIDEIEVEEYADVEVEVVSVVEFEVEVEDELVVVVVVKQVVQISVAGAMPVSFRQGRCTVARGWTTSEIDEVSTSCPSHPPIHIFQSILHRREGLTSRYGSSSHGVLECCN